MKLLNTFALGVAVLGFTTLGAVADKHGHSKHPSKEAHADHMMEGYQAVHTALFKDNLAVAKKAAAGMVKHDKKSSLAASATSLSKSKTIADARKEFEKMSKAAMAMIKGKKTWSVMHCPMAFDNKGAKWVQASGSKLQNPYFGAKMPHCGMVMK